MPLHRLVTFILTIFLIVPLSANDDAWISNTIELTINTRFQQALDLLKKRASLMPDDYRTHFYIAATINSQMTHFENSDGADLFDKSIDRTIELIDRELAEMDTLPSKNRAILFFFKGSALGYRAYYQGRNSDWLAAVSNGVKSVGYLNDALAADSTLYGAYLGIGVYKYWRYSRLKFISWLPFIPDDRDQGITMIKKAIACDSLSRYMAMHQLVYILLDYDKMDEAIYYADIVVRKYPDSQFMWWANAHAYFKSKQYAQAESAYLKLYTMISADPYRNDSHLLKCDWKLATIYFEQSDYSRCRQRCENLVQAAKRMDLTNEDRALLDLADERIEECRHRLSKE